MKTFPELTEAQQKAAFEFAYQALIQSMDIEFRHMLDVDPRLSVHMVDLAEDAAHCGLYTDDGKPFLEDSDEVTPYYFLGGCI